MFLFVKEFCFRVRVRVDTNPNPKQKQHSLQKDTPQPRVLLATVGTDFAPHRCYRTERREQATRISYAFHLTLCLFGSFLILVVFQFSSVWSSLIVYRSCIFALCVTQVSMFRPREGYGLRCDIEPQTAIF